MRPAARCSGRGRDQGGTVVGQRQAEAVGPHRRLGAEAFPAETSSEPFELRLLFRRKAHQAYVERVCSTMVQSGWSGDLDRLTIADVPAGRLRDGLLRRRADLGLSTADLAPVCVDENGVPWPRRS